MKRLFSALLLSLIVGQALAQDIGTPETPPTQILTIDIERLNRETRIGVEVLSLFQEEIETLGAENERILAELTDEEQKLTEDRATMEPAEFRTLADAFDGKVQQIRSDQDEKLRLLQERQEQARQRLLRDYNVVIFEILRERGALVLLDRRQVYLSADALDITDEAIQRINAAIDASDQ